MALKQFFCGENAMQYYISCFDPYGFKVHRIPFFRKINRVTGFNIAKEWAEIMN